MRIASYNLRRGGSSKNWVTLLQSAVPDVAFLQECGGWINEDAGDLWSPPPTLIWGEVPGVRWGSAIVLNLEPERTLQVRGFEGWVCGIEVADPSGSGRLLHLYSIHAPPRPTYVKAVHAIADDISAQRGTADVILAGDFNWTVGRRAEGEARRNKRGELELLERLEVELGVINVWSVGNPDQPLQQTLRWVGDVSVPYHCDGIFIPKEWATCVSTAEILSGEDWSSLSDHNPVVCTLEVATWSEMFRRGEVPTSGSDSV